MLHIVGYFPLLADSSFEISGPRKVPRSPRNQNEVQRASIIADFALNEGSVDDGHDPMIAARCIEASFELSSQEMVPGVVFFEGRRRKGLRGSREEVLL